MKKSTKNKIGDGKINTGMEMVEAEEERLWEQNPLEALKYEKIEFRKKLNWWARFSLSLIVVLTFIFLISLLLPKAKLKQNILFSTLSRFRF